MLDRWTPPSAHLIQVKYRQLTATARRYRTFCSCGWRSDEGDLAQLENCPVQEALEERARRAPKVLNTDHGRPKIVETVEWLPLDKPVSSR